MIWKFRTQNEDEGEALMPTAQQNSSSGPAALFAILALIMLAIVLVIMWLQNASSASSAIVLPTLKPSSIPTSAPSATPTPGTPEEVLRSIAVQQLTKSLLSSRLDAGGLIAVVEYDLDGSINGDWIVFQGAYNLSKIAPEIFTRIRSASTLELVGNATFTDVNGKSKRDMAFKMTLHRQSADKIDWNNFLIQNFGRILTQNPNGLYLHPVLREPWDRFVNKR